MSAVNCWRNTLAAAALLLGLQLHAAGEIIDTYNATDAYTATNSSTVVGDLLQYNWNISVRNNANIETNWDEKCTQVKLYDVYSVSNPVAQSLPSYWTLTATAGSETNL